MRDDTIYRLLSNLKNQMLMGLHQLNLQLSGESIRAKAVEKILMEKKIMTEDDLKKKMAEVIKELNSTPVKEAKKAEEEKDKKKLIKPTGAEVKKVEDSKAIEPKK